MSGTAEAGTASRALGPVRQKAQNMKERAGEVKETLDETYDQAEQMAQPYADQVVEGRAGATIFDRMADNANAIIVLIFTLAIGGIMLLFLQNVEIPGVNISDSEFMTNLFEQGFNALTLVVSVIAILVLVIVMYWVRKFLQERNNPRT